MKRVIFSAAAMTAALIAAAPIAAQQAPATPRQTPGEAPTQQQQTAPDPAAPATPAAPANPADQVAQVVDSQWATYDGNGDGKLSKAEFVAWMTALRAQAPGGDKSAAETRKWADTAFAQTDTDKSKSVSKDELTAFLSKNPG